MVARLTRIIPLLLLLAFVAGVVYVVAAWRYSPARAKEILIKAFTVLNVALTAFFGLASLYALSESNGDVLDLTLSFMVTALVALGITRICRAVFLKHNPSYRMKPMKARSRRRPKSGAFFMAREGAGKTILERAGQHLSKSMPLRWLPTVKCPL